MPCPLNWGQCSAVSTSVHEDIWNGSHCCMGLILASQWIISSFLSISFLPSFLSLFLTAFLSFLSSIFRFHILLVFRGDWCPFMARHPAHINYGNSVYGVDSSLPNYSIRGEKNYRVLTVQQAKSWGEENVDWLGIYGRLKCTYPTSYNPRITLSTSNPFLFFAIQRCTRLIGRCVSWCGQNQTLWWLSTTPL